MFIHSCKIVPFTAIISILSLASSANSVFAEVADKTAIPSPALYNQLEAFHGHVCAGSILGARLGLAAKESLKAEGGKGKFSAQYYKLSCPVDGIQVAAGTTYGSKALSVQDRDEHRLVLTAEENKFSVEAKLTKRAEEMGLKSRDLKKQAKELSSNAPERLQIEREVEEINSWLKNAPTEEVVVVSPLKIKGRTPSPAN